MRRILLIAIGVGVLFFGLVAAGNFGFGPVVITREGEQKLILMFGQVQRTTSPGISWRIPGLQQVQTYEHRWRYLSTETTTIQTKDGETLNVDNYVVWKISDPKAFRRSFPGGEADARRRIDRGVRDDVREVIGRHTLPNVLKDLRAEIMQEISNKSREMLNQDGIAVADVRINRTELPEQTEDSVYLRMRTERERLAREKRAEGEEERRTIRAGADREARVIVAEAKRDAEIAKGQGDAQAAGIYAKAFGNDPEFYDFIRSLEAYRKSIDENTTLVLSPQAEFFRFLESTRPNGAGTDGAATAPQTR